MIPILYTTPMCSQCHDVDKKLTAESITFRLHEVKPDKALDDKELRRAIGKLRANGHVGKFRDLLVMPILEVGGNAYNYEEITKYFPVIMEAMQLETPEPVSPKEETLQKRHAENADLVTRVQATMEKLVTKSDMKTAIETMFDTFDDAEQFAFLVGARLASHSAAIRVNRFADMIKHETSILDPYREKQKRYTHEGIRNYKRAVRQFGTREIPRTYEQGQKRPENSPSDIRKGRRLPSICRA